MLNEIIKIAADVLKVTDDSIRADSDIAEELGADSIDVIEIVAEAEELAGIIIPDDAIPDFKTVRDISDYIDKIKSREKH